MKKAWNSPKIEELSIAATAYDPQSGTVPDYSLINQQTGEVIKTYYQQSGPLNPPPF
jgi:hypothetical protein